MKYAIALCLFFAVVSANAQIVSVTDMFSILGKKDTTSINKLLNKLGYSGFMIEDSIPNTKILGGFSTVGLPCPSAKENKGDEITYEVETGKRCLYVKFASMCFDHYKSLVASFKTAGFSIGNALVPIIPKGKGSSNHDIPNEFEYTSTYKGFRLSIFVGHEPTGLLYHVLLEPEGK